MLLKLTVLITVLFSQVSVAENADCYAKCFGQGRMPQLCSSLCGGGQGSASIRVVTPTAMPSAGLPAQAPQSSPEVLRAQCVVQRDLSACKQLQEALKPTVATAEAVAAANSAPPAMPPFRTQQLNQRLTQQNIPEAMRQKCLDELNLQVCAEIDDLLAGKKPVPTK